MTWLSNFLWSEKKVVQDEPWVAPWNERVAALEAMAKEAGLKISDEPVPWRGMSKFQRILMAMAKRELLRELDEKE